MRLIFKVPGRPQDQLQLQEGERLDGGAALVHGGEEFEVSDKRARELLAGYYPTIQPVAVKKRRVTPRPAKPAKPAEPAKQK